MRRLMNILISSCKKNTLLMEKQMVVDRLSLGERIRLKMHTSMCSACKNYQKQSETIENAFKKHLASKPDNSVKLPEVAKKRIIDALEEK